MPEKFISHINVNGEDYTIKDPHATGEGAIPGDGTISIQKNGTTIDSFSVNQSSNKTINISIPVSASDVGALSSSTRYAKTVELDINDTGSTADYVVTITLKDQNGNTLNSDTIDLPLESMVVNGTYNSAQKKVVLTLKNGNTVSFSIADLISGLQSEITSSNKLSADLVDDTNSVNKFLKGVLPLVQGGTGVTTLQELKELLGVDSFSTPIKVNETTINTIDGSKIFSGTNAPFGTNIDWTGIQIGSDAGADGDIWQLVSASVNGDNRLVFRKNDGTGWSDWTSVVLKDTLINQISANDETNRTWTSGQIATAVGKEYGTTWNDNSDWASAPWYPIATIDVTTTYTNVTLALHIQRGNGTSQKSVGTFVVTARVNESFTNITSFNSVWTNVEDGLLADDTYYKVRATCIKYDNKATFTVWLKLSTRYDSFSYRKIRGAYRNSRSDNGFDPDCWVINSWENVNGYSLYHTGDDVIQCVPSFGDTVKSSLSFMYNDTSSYEQGTASNPVYINHGSVKLLTDDVSGTHTDYTIRLPKKNGTMALLSDIPSVPTDYIPLSGTSSSSPVTGKIEFTGNASYLLFDTNNTGIRFVDSSDDQFSGVAWNGANFWVGARAGSQPTHAGKTFISTGWDTTNNEGYNTIALSIPRSKDGSTTATTRYVIHTGDNTFNAEDTLDEAKEIKLNNSSYSKDIRFRATNSHADLWFGAFGSSNDGGGIYNIAGGGFVLKSSTASGSLVNTFYGNASSATAIAMNQMQSTSEVTRYLTLTPNLSGDATNQYANNGLWTKSTYGSTSAVGYTHLHLGNTTSSGSAGNNRGFLYIHGPGSAYASLQFDGTSNAGLSLPTSGGTLALTSQIKTYTGLANDISINSSNVISLSTTGVTAGYYGPASSVTGNDGNTISVPYFYVDSKGRISSVVNKTYTSKNTTYSAGTGLDLSGTTFSVEGPETVTISLNSSYVTLDSQSVYKDPGTGWVYGTWKCTVTKAFSTSSNTSIVTFPSGSRLTTGQVPVQCYSTSQKKHQFYIAWLNANVVRVFSSGVNSSNLPSVGDTLIFSVGFFNQKGI